MSLENIDNQQSWRQALVHSLPVAMGYFPAGIAFGVLMSAAHLPLLLTFLLSLIVYSGAAQYAAIPFFASGAGIFALTLNTAVINLRHIFYGIPLLPFLPQSAWKRAYCYFALTDESFSVLTTLPEEKRQGLFVKIVFLNQCYWLIASIIGFVLGAGLNELIPHLDFALACLFVILWYEQFLSKGIVWPTLLAISAFLLAKSISHNYVLLLSVALCAAFILLRSFWQPSVLQKAKVGGSIWLIITAFLLFYLWQNVHENAFIAPLSGSVQPLTMQIIAVLCMGAITFLLRAAPSLIPKKWFHSERLQALNVALPLSVMGILILASVQIDLAIGGQYDEFIAQCVALLTVWLAYRLKRNVLLGMVVGVAVLNGMLWIFQVA